MAFSENTSCVCGTGTPSAANSPTGKLKAERSYTRPQMDNIKLPLALPAGKRGEATTLLPLWPSCISSRPHHSNPNSLTPVLHSSIFHTGRNSGLKTSVNESRACFGQCNRPPAPLTWRLRTTGNANHLNLVHILIDLATNWLLQLATAEDDCSS
jgi:hypothetical protein